MAERPQPPDREPLLARFFGAGARGAGRVAEATGLDRAIEEATSEAVVRALESPAAERAIAQAVESAAVERSLVRVIDSEMVERVWERLLVSDEAQKLVERIAQAPEVRQAIAYQGVGLLDDIGAQIGRIARRLDALLDRLARALFRRAQRTAQPPQAGVVSRALALAIDVGILNLILLVASALIGSLASALFGADAELSVEAVLAAAGVWILAEGAYLLTFWSLSGETPGMRFLDIRLRGPDGPRIGFRRSFRRLLGLGLAVLPLGLGLLIGMLDERRRSLADRLAETEVLYLPPRREAPWAARSQPGDAPREPGEGLGQPPGS
jgi:uncharacterized RDD family membrane protein YckC